MDVRKRAFTFEIYSDVVCLGPGSFLEVRKVLPLLVEVSDDHPSFHVVALSLPGFGFSEAPKKKGFDSAMFAEVSALKYPTSLVLTLSVRLGTSSCLGWVMINTVRARCHVAQRLC